MNQRTNSPEPPGNDQKRGRRQGQHAGSFTFLRKIFDISDRSYWDMISTAGTIGWHMVTCTFVGMGMGWLIDKWAGTKPTWTMVFLVFGIVAGFRNMYQENKRLQKKFYGEDATTRSDASGERSEGKKGSEDPAAEGRRPKNDNGE